MVNPSKLSTISITIILPIIIKSILNVFPIFLLPYPKDSTDFIRKIKYLYYIGMFLSFSSFLYSKELSILYVDF